MATDSDAGFREFEHSGDVGIEAWGTTYAELIEQATRGLFGLMVWGEASAAGPVERTIQVRAATPTDLIVDWLNEVVTAAATHGEVYDNVSVQSADETSASGTIRGEPFDAARHERRFDVKAATYHGLVCEKTADGFHARVVFDL